MWPGPRRSSRPSSPPWPSVTRAPAHGSPAPASRRRLRRARRAGRGADDQRARGARPRRATGAPGARPRDRAGAGCRCPNADDPKRRVAWGWTSDTRSLTEPTARVLLAVNARTPRRPRDPGRGARPARRPPVRGRRLELRQRVRLRRRPEELPADHRDRADRAPGRRRGARGPGAALPRRRVARSSPAG